MFRIIKGVCGLFLAAVLVQFGMRLAQDRTALDWKAEFPDAAEVCAWGTSVASRLWDAAGVAADEIGDLLLGEQ